MFHYQIDVLFLIDTRITNEDQSKHTLRACLGHGYTILHTPPITHSPGGQTIIVAPSWSGAFQSFWSDPSELGCLTEVTLRSGLQNVKLFGAYWPCSNTAPHSFETTLTAKLPPSTHYTDWRSYFEYHLLGRLHHDQGVDCAWTLGGDFNCSLRKRIGMPEPTTLGEWTHLMNLQTPTSPSECWRNAPTYVSTLGQSRIDHTFYGGRGCECLYATHYEGETYGDYTDHRPLSLSLKLQHGRGPAGLRSTKPLPLYKALLLPQSPEDERRFSEAISTWILQHPTPTTYSPMRSGRWLYAFSSAANKIVGNLTNPHKRKMRQGFSPPGLYLTHTLHTGRLIRRGLQGDEHHRPWDSRHAFSKTLQAYNRWRAKTSDVLANTTADTAYVRTLQSYKTNPLLSIPSPTLMSLPDICAMLNRALPLLRLRLHAASRQCLRRQA